MAWSIRSSRGHWQVLLPVGVTLLQQQHHQYLCIFGHLHFCHISLLLCSGCQVLCLLHCHQFSVSLHLPPRLQRQLCFGFRGRRQKPDNAKPHSGCLSTCQGAADLLSPGPRQSPSPSPHCPCCLALEPFLPTYFLQNHLAPFVTLLNHSSKMGFLHKLPICNLKSGVTLEESLTFRFSSVEWEPKGLPCPHCVVLN